MNSKEMLSSVLKTTQMGQAGIRSVLNSTMQPGLRRTLEAQLQEYDMIESEAHAVASQRGWEIPELDPAMRSMASMITRMKLIGIHTDSKIADMMIQGSTKGVIKGIRNQHRCTQEDCRVSTLSQRLLDTEAANIRQMQSFL